MITENYHFINIEHQRAQKAAEKARGTPEYVSAVKKFLPMVINSGLLQTLAFYDSKKYLRPVFKDISEYLAEWLRRYGSNSSPGGVMEQVRNLPAARFRACTMEILAYVLWLKRFSEARKPEKSIAGQSEQTAEKGASDVAIRN